jgi:L-fucose isomerase-like protein
MLDIAVLYLPIGRKTFDLEAGEQVRSESQALLEGNCEKVYSPNEILTSVEDLESFLHTIQTKKIDIIIYQSVTFADAEFITKTIELFSQPVIVWSVREPGVGARLRLNSLTGGNATSHTLKSHGRFYRFLFGNPDEVSLQNLLFTYLKTEEVVNQLAALKVGVVGETPPGFYFSGTDVAALKEKVGATVHHIDLHKAFDACKEIPEEAYLAVIERAEKQVIGLDRTDEKVQKFARFTAYIMQYAKQYGIDAFAIRNWPEFFNDYGAAGDSTLSHLTEEGLAAANESDIHGSISMYILQALSGEIPYLGDMVHLNEDNNSVTFWHDGSGAYSLANPKTGAKPGVHPNRKLGLTMEFGLKPGRVTIFRLSKVADEFRLFIMKGEALDTPQQFWGTSAEVKLDNDAVKTVYDLMDDGLEPHYALVYADVADHLVDLGKRLGIKTIKYF